ncbi:hypothetical protein QBC40DRAFT_313858 [Triangularia verruculosa]|uniref:Uncharacterized protein n=1 Tax=Triangularia verruculosa TaxID=2587418 RepID=A0AAN6XBF2_9PEZI|nr:hypothetical protein QBC40DRAFT_313858 [Triangularia verruculosa]
MAYRTRTPSTSSTSSDWEEAQISDTGEWASDHYSDSDSDDWTCSDSDTTSTTSTDDGAEAEADAAVQDKIEAMMDTGAAMAHVGESEVEVEKVTEEETSAINSEAPEIAENVTLPSPAPAQERASSPSPSPSCPPARASPPAPASAPTPTPAPDTPTPSPQPAQPPRPLSLQARITLATRYYTLLARLEASLAQELAALPPAQPPTPSPPVSFATRLQRYRAYDEAYLAAAEADRLHRQNLNLPPKGLLARIGDWLAGGPTADFRREVPHPSLWDRRQAEIEYWAVLEERYREERRVRERYDRLKEKSRREYVEKLNQGLPEGAMTWF